MSALALLKPTQTQAPKEVREGHVLPGARRRGAGATKVKAFGRSGADGVGEKCNASRNIYIKHIYIYGPELLVTPPDQVMVHGVAPRPPSGGGRGVGLVPYRIVLHRIVLYSMLGRCAWGQGLGGPYHLGGRDRDPAL